MSFKLKNKNGNYTNPLEYVELEVYNENATQSSTPTLKKFYMETNIQVQPGGTYNNVGFGTLVIPTSGKTLTSIDILSGPNEIEENEQYADYSWEIQANWSDGSSEEIFDTNVIGFEPSVAQYNQDTVKVYILGYDDKYVEKTVEVKKSQPDKCLVTINTIPGVSFTLTSGGTQITSETYVDLNSTLNISYTADDISKYNISYKMGSATVHISQPTDVQVTDDITVSAELKPTDYTYTWDNTIVSGNTSGDDKKIGSNTSSIGQTGSHTGPMTIYDGNNVITGLTDDTLNYVHISMPNKSSYTKAPVNLKMKRSNGTWQVVTCYDNAERKDMFTKNPKFYIQDGKLYCTSFGEYDVNGTHIIMQYSSTLQGETVRITISSDPDSEV